MIVVADTSPLNYLILLGKAQVLPELYGHIVVPIAVITELRHSEAPDLVHSWAINPPAWLEIVRPRKIDSTLVPELGAGEREAISVALELGADLLLIDERIGRQAAEARSLQVAGTLAVLLRAGVLGLLDFPVALKELRSLGFRISREIEGKMLASYERQLHHN
jgi:predicted nucleic acid-binding protein